MSSRFGIITNNMYWQLGPNLFVAGVPTDEFDYFAETGRQRGFQWCWVASVQMVLNYHGLRVQQEQIAQRIFGASYDLPANLEQILYALSGWAPDTRGRFSQIHAVPYVLNNSQLVSDLANKWPLVVGFSGNPNGHACVLTAVKYSLAPPVNQPFLLSAIIRDPWPGNVGKQEIAWPPDRSPFNFSVRVSVTRL